MTIKKLRLKAKLYFTLHPYSEGIECVKQCKYYKICKSDWPWKENENYIFVHPGDRDNREECIKWLDDK